MAVPRNLVKIFSLVVLLAFLSMLYLVYSGRNLHEFMQHSVNVSESLVEHPLFILMRQALKPKAEVDQETVADLSSKKFYQHFLTKN